MNCLVYAINTWMNPLRTWNVANPIAQNRENEILVFHNIVWFLPDSFFGFLRWFRPNCDFGIQACLFMPPPRIIRWNRSSSSRKHHAAEKRKKASMLRITS
jgi:hypothetical protein